MTQDQQVKQIVEELISGSNVALFGGPGIGKSSLLHSAISLLEAKDVVVVHVDLQSCRSAVDALESILGMDRGTSTKDILKMWSDLFANLDKSQSQVFVLDEFDAVAKFQDASLFIRIIREYFQNSPREKVSMAIASRRPLRLIEEALMNGISTLDSVFNPHHPGLLDEEDLSFLWPGLEASSDDGKALLTWSGGVRVLAYRYYDTVIKKRMTDNDIKYDRALWAEQMVDHCERINLGAALYQYVLGPITEPRPLIHARLFSMSLIGNLKTGPLPGDGLLWSFAPFVEEVRSRQDSLSAWGQRGELELEARRLLVDVLRSTGLPSERIRAFGKLDVGWRTALEQGATNPTLREAINCQPEGSLGQILADAWPFSTLRLEPDDQKYWIAQFEDLGGIGRLCGEIRIMDQIDCGDRADAFRSQRVSASRPKSSDKEAAFTTSKIYNIDGNAVIADANSGSQLSVKGSGNSRLRFESTEASPKSLRKIGSLIGIGASLVTIAGFAMKFMFR